MTDADSLPDPPLEPERAAVGLIETMRAELAPADAGGGRIALLDLHLERLARAARAWNRPLNADSLRRQIDAALAAHATGGAPSAARVRVVLRADGAEVTVAPAAQTAFETVAVYPDPLPEAGTWRCAYKTTDRAHYDRAVAWAETIGADEPLLLNTRGEILEGARTNVWLREGGAWVTPSLASGGLGGVARAAWLAEASASEGIVTPERLRAADGVWLSNAVRGRMRVNVVKRQAVGEPICAPSSR